MTLRLILTRHAKSSWSAPGLDDHERPLNRRGQASAEALGRWLAGRRIVPAQTFCSSALRAQQTWQGIAAQLPAPAGAPGTTLEVLPALYLADPETMLAVLARADAPVVMLIAHNPGIAIMAGNLVRNTPDDPRISRCPTGATAIIDLAAANWPEAAWHSGTLVDFVIPRDLL